MKAYPRVLVLLASRNGARWVEEQIESIAAQEGVLVSIRVHDDCSSDATVALIKTTCERLGLSLIIHVNGQPSGSAGANFFGLFQQADASDYAYVALADQDDIWFPRKLVHAIDRLKETGAAGYSAAVLATWPDGKTASLKQCGKPSAADFLFEGAGQGCTFVLPVSTFLQVQSLCRHESEALATFHYHDWLVYLVVRASGKRWHFDQRPCTSYRQHGTNEIGARRGWESVRRRLRLVREGWYREQLITACKLYAVAGGRGRTVPDLQELLRRRGWTTHVQLAFWCLRNGRRRLTDRVALSCFALLGYLSPHKA